MTNDVKKENEKKSATNAETLKGKTKIVKRSVRRSTVQHEKQKRSNPPSKKSSPVEVQKTLNSKTNLKKKVQAEEPNLCHEHIQCKLDAISEGQKIDSVCWAAAAKCMKENKELLLKARKQIDELRMENTILKGFLKASLSEGEKYKIQLEDEILRKMLEEY